MINKPDKLDREQRAVMANRLTKLIREDGWIDVLNLIAEQEDTLVSGIMNTMGEERIEKIGELKRNRYFVTMIKRAIECEVNK